MSFLLDTNVVSELRKPALKVDPGVLAWSEKHPLVEQFLSAVTVFELELGVALKEQRDPAQGKMLRAWLENQVKPTFAGRILPFDDAVAGYAARMHVNDPRPLADSFIAATAQLHNLTVVTRNERDFTSFGVPCVNPWQEEQKH
mgnify:CR=1 FL=1